MSQKSRAHVAFHADIQRV
jgi:methyl-accepting chemotaxis protein